MSTNPGPKVGDQLYSYDSAELHTERTRPDGEEAEDLGQAERRMTAQEDELDVRLPRSADHPTAPRAPDDYAPQS